MANLVILGKDSTEVKKIIIAIIALVIFCVSARAEIIKCSKMKGQLLNIQKQYVPVDFSGDSVVVQQKTKAPQQL